jgi:hypothetical protein
MTAHILAVGRPYHPERRSWPEGAAFLYHQGYELLLRYAGPSPREVDAVSGGPAALAFVQHRSALLFLFRFADPSVQRFEPHATSANRTGSAIPWSDVPMEPHLWTELPPEEDNAPLRIVLLDAETGIVRALRLVLLAPSFTEALRAAALQARAAYAGEAIFQRDVADAERQASSADMARAAPYLTTLPRTTGEKRDA